MNAPLVRLTNAFTKPFDNAVAAARTCYSSRIVLPEDVSKDEDSRSRRDGIARSIYLAGHHTTLQHASFQFAIEKVSRLCIWSFLHSHPYYNSEQVSQRYVQVSPQNFSVPDLPENCLELYQGTVRDLMNAYQKLQELLEPAVQKEFAHLFPGRDAGDKQWKGWVKKKCQETARYVLPLSTQAHLYHTISGLTLLRYIRLSKSFDVPKEQSLLVQAMADAVRSADPDFFKNAEDPMPLESTPEHLFFAERDVASHAADFTKEFDRSLEGWTSRLTSYKTDAEKITAEAVRNVLGAAEGSLSGTEAIERLMAPARNPYLSETMNLTHHAKITRAMVHAHFTFRKKISHAADSQDQRHRTVPASRPILEKHLSDQPDFIVPKLIRTSPGALEFYGRTMKELWERIGQILNSGAPIESALYLLPNAFPIRFDESGTLLDFHHKWVHRLCYTAQEEIWKNALEEVRQVEALFPNIGKYLRAPCTLRKAAGRKPFCPEGERFCGTPVWKLPLEKYSRIL